MQKFPFLFSLTRGHRLFRPIKQRMQELNQILRRNRTIYNAHFLYRMPLRQIVSLPEDLIKGLLVKKADYVKAYRFLDYVVIVNNFNPETFCYESIRNTNKKYAWIYHKSYGTRMHQSIVREEVDCEKFDSYMKYTSFYLQQSNFVDLSPKLVKRLRPVDLNEKYAEPIIELLRYHITAYAPHLITKFVDQTIQERILCESRYAADEPPPWHWLQDI